MVYGDAESVSGVKIRFNHNKHQKAKMATNSDKNMKKKHAEFLIKWFAILNDALG